MMGGFYDIEVSLTGIQPRIWRRFLISSDATFGDLHNAIQDAFGWFDEHLWAFQVPGPDGSTIAGIPDEDDDYDTTPDAWKVSLSNYFDLGAGEDRCEYLYDFGDRWHHEVVLKGKVKGVGDFFQKLVAGERACPPEDCGGTAGYERIVSFLQTGIDPDGENAEVIAEWIGPWRPYEFHLGEFQEVFDR
jgi:hypothetical protein